MSFSPSPPQTQSPTIIGELVRHKACAPLVAELVARSPALGRAAQVVALEADSVEVYRRLVERTGLRVSGELVDVLLEPTAQGISRWNEVVLHKRPLADELSMNEPRLREAMEHAQAGWSSASAKMARAGSDNDSSAGNVASTSNPTDNRSAQNNMMDDNYYEDDEDEDEEESQIESESFSEDLMSDAQSESGESVG